jgi:ubiquitin carboxyl-terminal hydrolase 8
MTESINISDIKYGICRFNNNSGVICYMNSIFAVLQQTPILVDYILTGKFKDRLLLNHTNNAELIDSILFQFYNIIKISHTYDNFKINPDSFRRAATIKNNMWGKHQHQDSQEFLTFLLNSIEEEISDKVIFVPGINSNINYNSTNNNLINLLALNAWHNYIKNEYSIIKNLFGGLTHGTIKCEKCNNVSNNFDFFQVLQLSIPNISTITLENCLDDFIKNEQMDKYNMIRCDFCGIKNKSTKNTMIWTTPKVLIIQLKRFMVNNYGIVTQKISKLVEYPMKLDLSKYIDKDSPYLDKCKYNLYAVNNHHSLFGKSINAGHYTTMVLNKFNNKWYNFDDSNILEEVDNDDIINNNAYMLFYYRAN